MPGSGASRHPVNRGKGAALLSAASLATGTHVLPFDADLEYSPDDIPLMLAPISARRCSVVYGRAAPRLQHEILLIRVCRSEPVSDPAG